VIPSLDFDTSWAFQYQTQGIFRATKRSAKTKPFMDRSLVSLGYAWRYSDMSDAIQTPGFPSCLWMIDTGDAQGFTDSIPVITSPIRKLFDEATPRQFSGDRSQGALD
jgi:hypothetical protein